MSPELNKSISIHFRDDHPSTEQIKKYRVKKKDEKDEDCKQRGWRQTDSEKERRQQNEGKWNTNGPPKYNKHRMNADSCSLMIGKQMTSSNTLCSVS